MVFLFRHLGTACAVVLFLAASVSIGLAHGGPPLRVGVTQDPLVTSVARLVLVHLREGVGFAVDWREYPDAPALRAAFAAGGIDIAVGLTDPGQLPSAPASADCPPESLAPLVEALRRRWGGEVFLLGFPAGSAACARPALIVSHTVLEDLRFGILGKESTRMASFITREDVAAVRAAAGGGGERAATAAARAALAAKTQR